MDADGNVGIGTTSPTQKLDVHGNLVLSGAGDYLTIGGNYIASVAVGELNIGAGLIGAYGRDTAYIRLFGKDDASRGGDMYIMTPNDGNTVSERRITILGNQDADAVGIGVDSPGYPLEVACASTTWTDRGSSISCSDYAEVYEHSEKKEDLESGQVLVLDSENEGKVKISTKSHDKMVVGVVSGSPGMLIGIGDSVGIGGIDANNLDNKSLPMSLSGKVIVQVIGDVKIGDLLTTSDARGKAMACSDHKKCQGAILGKAMTNDKKGEVLALITLQ
jgi:hypothetical protein